MAAFPFVGGAYRARSVNFDAQRCVNLYPELSQSGTSKSVAALYGTPGLRLWSTLPTNAVRGLLRFSESVLIAVAGNAVYSITSAGVATQVGSVDSATTPVGIASNGIDVMIVTGPSGYVYRPATGAFNTITDPDFVGADVVNFFDGYFVMNKPNTGQFYITQLYGTSIDGLDFATAEGSPDLLVSLLVDHRELWLFGEVSTEIWFNSGNADFPFERNQGAFLEVGCAAKYSPAKMDNVVYWLGRDNSGQGIVYRAQGYQPQRVSDYGVEYAIGQMPRIDDAIGFSYQQEGHHFYVLTFPTARQTWVFDANSSMWHERAYWDAEAAAFDRHRANCVAPFAGEVLVGDWQDGRIYSFDLDYYTDDGDTIRRVRSCAHLHADMKLQFFNSLQIDMEAGVGVSGSDGSLPAPILLDTFTAADGTDPTSRDMDIHPEFSARWESASIGPPLNVDGQILSNRLTFDSAVDPGDGEGNVSLLYEPATEGQTIASAYPILLVMQSNIVDTGTGAAAQFELTDTAATMLRCEISSTGTASGYASGNSDFVSFDDYELGVGLHTVGLYVTQTSAALYANGSVLESFDTTYELGTDLTRSTVEILAATVSAGYGVERVAIYSGVTALQASLITQGIYSVLPGPGVMPQAMLDWSDDGGHSWSGEHWASMGKIGEYRKRVKWRRLGRSRDRIFRLTITDPVKVAIIGATAEVTVGAA